ncbi:uncharacterized protein V1518DRAFT_376474 [Limtongia smithiae]|uniref:uncharacterized protein n=1 Tax=Limtongia smithiae TaxID=1125753 RepID=UPI0034CF28AA
MNKLLKTSSARPGIIRLDDQTFANAIAAPRDYAVVVLLTAEAPQMGCQLCRQFAPEYNLVASSWVKSHPKGDGLFFAMLDFKDGQKTFQSLGLKTAPNMWVYKASEHEGAGPIHLDVSQAVDLRSSIIRFVESEVPGVQIKLHIPRDYSKMIYAVLGGATLVVSLKAIYPFIKPIIESRTIWAGISLVAILMFISGHMFNNIRHTPYVAGNRNGGVQYIAPGFSQQFGMETQIIAVLYALLSFGAISLSIKLPRMANVTKQNLATITWCVLILCCYSSLMFIFRMKNGGYPFSLPPMSL